jgi:signal transduction histidine kinase
VLCAPIRSAGRQLGILYVDSRRVGSLLSEKDLALLSAFAALAGSALANARLIDDLRRKGDLLAQMAHELRSPLQAIALHASAAKLRAESDGDVDAISTQASRLAQIVDRTLELSRIEAGALKMARAKVDVAEVVRVAMAGVQPFALMKSIDVRFSVEADVPKVEGDFDRLVQVLTNLLGNAVQYSDQGARVWLRLAAGDPVLPARPQPRIEVEDGPPSADFPLPPSAQVLVIDQGPGIRPEDLGRIFTPFFHGGEDTGTGLGLVISRQIAREHGGDLRVDSKPGEGATFVLSLPGAP